MTSMRGCSQTDPIDGGRFAAAAAAVGGSRTMASLSASDEESEVKPEIWLLLAAMCVVKELKGYYWTSTCAILILHVLVSFICRGNEDFSKARCAVMLWKRRF